MKQKLIFASHNQNKTREINALFSELLDIVSLEDIGFFEEIVESGMTLKQNAHIKARTIFEATGSNCFADDTGLLVDALDGEPGVYSARYAGIEKDSDKNISKVLHKLSGIKNRNAKFETVICLIYNGDNHYFHGILEGEIIEMPKGSDGFGYDPIFKPFGSTQTLAEMNLGQKNQISHRAKALHEMHRFLIQKIAANSF